VSDRPFRIGLVGAGRMGRTHLRALAQSSVVSVEAVVEPIESAGAEIAATGRRVYGNLAELLDARAVDGVLVAAPTDRHVDLVAELVEAGMPTLCEKPFGTSSARLREVEGLIDASGVPVQVAYWRRYVPALQALRQRILDGELGELHLLTSFQWDGAPPSAEFRAHSGGIFRDMGVHEFDQVRWLSGQELVEIQAVPGPAGNDANVPDPDSAEAIASLSRGAAAFISLGLHFPGGDMCRAEVFGSRDAVRVDFLDPRDGERAQLDALRRQAEAFAAFARGGPRTGASIADAAAALEAAERAAAAMQAMAPARAAALGARA
jgi:myo-inositol 2-dehydrogenase / D-chiro-inositol 1-dehydrogenase